MKVFISWSGPKSHDIAERLHKWLPYIVQPLKPFLSSGDIRKGARWSDVLAHELQETKYGIICITRQNIMSPWLNFEAGALSKMTGQACVSPVLFGVDPSRLTGPLSQFQATVFDEKGEEMFGLVSSINDNLPDEHKVLPAVLKDTFDNYWWPRVSADIREAVSSETDETEMIFPWLYSVTDLVTRESHDEWESVWVIHPEPLKDWHLLRETVQKNLGRGVHYDFIVPTPQFDVLRGLILEEVHGQDDGTSTGIDVTRVRIGSLGQDDFNNLAATHYRVLNSKCNRETPARVLFQIPIGRDGFWAAAEGAAIENFHMRFSAMRDKAKLIEVCSLSQLTSAASDAAPPAALGAKGRTAGDKNVAPPRAAANHERDVHTNSRRAVGRLRAKR
ncbi:MAG TPA: toll/interleukin-1 receptor domain-containing protein [Pyrinomonadaceae bacterium]|nr:toll/interleukin-1 receptor domain-containing protein [Pyrinomonadaceae bacterium]